MKVTDELIGKLAQLAMLDFDPDEKEAIKADLNRILEFVEALDAIDTEGIEPLVHIGEEVNVWREDAVTEELSPKEALKNAPKHDSMYFKVPRVVRDSEHNPD